MSEAEKKYGNGPTEKDYEKADSVWLDYLNGNHKGEFGIKLIAQALASERAEAEKKIHELEKYIGGLMSGMGLTLYKERIRRSEAYREIAKRLAEGPGDFDVDAEAERLMKEGEICKP